MTARWRSPSPGGWLALRGPLMPKYIRVQCVCPKPMLAGWSLGISRPASRNGLYPHCSGLFFGQGREGHLECTVRSPSPPPAQSTAHHALRGPLRRSMVREASLSESLRIASPCLDVMLEVNPLRMVLSRFSTTVSRLGCGLQPVTRTVKICSCK